MSEGEGRGSNFIIMLPAAPVNSGGATNAPARTGERAALLAYGGPERLDGLRILVVDDEPDTLEMLKFGLSQFGASVSAAGSAEEALAALAGGGCDVLISDIGMPSVDGYELIRRVRQLPAERGGRVPAVALTAYARIEDRLQALRSGFQMHVPKPVELAELIMVTASLVGRGA
jgi:CheY-like chemotaxis protein